MKLWHDDSRKPPNDSWSWALTNAAAIELLVEAGPGGCEEASLDHDLGLEAVFDHEHPDRVYMAEGEPPCGKDLCRWLAEHPELIPPKVTLHSWSYPGAQAMARILGDAAEFHTPPTEIIVAPCER